MGEPDTHRRARKNFTGPPSVGGGSSKPEEGLPMDNYKAQYPFNHVRASESGHVEEWDDTPGAERLMKYHKSGTYEEIGPDGTRTVKVEMDNFTIVAGNDEVTVTGDVNFKVDGNMKIETGGDLEMVVGGEWKMEVTGDWKPDIMGDCTITSVGNLTTESGKINWVKGAGLKLN